VFSNLNWYNVVVLLLLALFIFGDKLPQMISDGLRMLRNLRRTAQNATSDLSRELGTDIRLEDLNPRTFVRKHLLSEVDEEALIRPFKSLSDDMKRHARDLQSDWDELGTSGNGAAGDGARGSEAGGADRDAPPAVRGDAVDPPRPRYDDIT
jgi:sec-independent protein translocase protein TatB